MKPDISNQEHFYTFIGKSKINAKEAARSLETSRTVRDNTYAYLTEKKEYIKNTFNIDLDKYESEWVNKVYNKSEDLYNIAKKLLEKYESGEERIVLLQIVKYCVVLKKCYNSRIAFELYTKQKNINYKQYLNYLIRKYVFLFIAIKFIKEDAHYILSTPLIRIDTLRNFNDPVNKIIDCLLIVGCVHLDIGIFFQ